MACAYCVVYNYGRGFSRRWYGRARQAKNFLLDLEAAGMAGWLYVADHKHAPVSNWRLRARTRASIEFERTSLDTIGLCSVTP